MELKSIFNEFSSKLQKYKNNDHFYDKYYKLKMSDAFFCAEDYKKCEFFYNVLKKINDKKNKVVLDAGSGTGILGFLALKLGFKFVYFIEHNPFTLEINKKIINEFNFKNCNFIKEDATKMNFKDNFDILVSETVTTGFFKEDFLKIVDNFKKQNQSLKIIPSNFIMTIKQIDQFEKLIHEDTVSISANNIEDFFRKNIYIKIQKNTKFLDWYFFIKEDDVQVQSGDCISFINKKRTNLIEEHPQMKNLNFIKK